MTYNRWSTVHIAPLSRAQFWSDASREAQMPHTPLVAQPERFEAACAEAGQALTLRRHAGYDHGYYFIASFIEDHLRHHAALLAD